MHYLLLIHLSYFKGFFLKMQAVFYLIHISSLLSLKFSFSNS